MVGALVATLVTHPVAAGKRRQHKQLLTQLFAASGQCMACHNGLVTTTGKDVSIGPDWRASMMANAARDPYWQAAVRRETLEHPTARAAIEDECSKCHMPMATFAAHAAGKRGEVFAHLPAGRPPTPTSPLAVDGVSCALCHQIAPDGLGTPESFVGGFVIDQRRGRGRRPVFGKYDVDSGRAQVMRSSSGFQPQQAAHMKSAELCATCHTLYTHSLDASGAVVGRLAEQVPYQEWQHSDFASRQSCQDCHLLPQPEPTPISSVLGQPRDGMRPHVFRGGNFLVLGMLAQHRKELGVVATPGELASTANRAREQLEQRTARLTLVSTALADGKLVVDVRVENQAGHKLPTAYPSRRVWLHLTVRDAPGAVVFESGALARDGSIVGNDNDADAQRFEPHYSTIERADQVQIYEPILGDPAGRVVTGLLTASQYLKDNRVLPRGFDKETAHADVGVYGEAVGDPDFLGGADVVRYSVPLGSHAGPFAIEAELYYQPIGFRWAENLGPIGALETDRFVRYYRGSAHASAVRLAAVSGAAR